MKMIREERQLTEKYFFDTDCLSAFLWVREESILVRLYAGRIILPAQVYNELQRVPHLLARVDTLKNNGDLSVESMEAGSEEYIDYLQMTTSPETGMRIIGSGEAAGIAMAKQRDGTLASNNLRDIRPYVEKYGISHITTGDILIEAMDAGIITEAEGNTIWSDMIRRRRMLPTTTFSEYLVIYRKPEEAKE
jgi:predicted nucleic acid-binding protein